MIKKVSKKTIKKIKKIKKLLSEPNIWINANKRCKCEGYIFKCLNDIRSGGIVVICRNCNKEVISFNILEYLI